MIFITVDRRTSRRWLLALGGLLVAAGVARAAMEYSHPAVRPVSRPALVVATATGPQPVYEVRTTEKKIALTFDISWGTKMPPLVLDVLKQYQVRSTFFLSGPWSRKNPDLVRRIMEDGHDIQSHGHKHDNFSTLSREAIKENIMQAHEILKELTGKEPNLIRPPNGDYDELSVRTAAELGYKTIIWSVDSLDWKNPSVDFMIKRVLSRAKPGAIVLLHASDSPKKTHEALPAIIEGLRKQGYELVTLTELLALEGKKAPAEEPAKEPETAPKQEPAPKPNKKR